MKTKTISNFGIIFAVALTMVTTIVFTACNSEDDFGGDLNGDITGQYSLATRMMTREIEAIQVSDTMTYQFGISLTEYSNAHGFDATVFVKFNRDSKNKLSVSLDSYISPFGCHVNDVSLSQHTYPGTYKLTASGKCEHGIYCSGANGTYVF